MSHDPLLNCPMLVWVVRLAITRWLQALLASAKGAVSGSDPPATEADAAVKLLKLLLAAPALAPYAAKASAIASGVNRFMESPGIVGSFGLRTRLVIRPGYRRDEARAEIFARPDDTAVSSARRALRNEARRGLRPQPFWVAMNLSRSGSP